ncbi:unnamed protein product, partial [marine sediment metagenome]
MENFLPKVYIIILNWNGLQDTVECLESLKKITYQNCKILIIDNGSKIDEAKILKDKFGDFIETIRSDKNLGFAGGNNIGFDYALDNNADMILILNNDTIVNPDFLEKMVSKMESNIGMVACKVLNYYKRKEINAMWSAVHRCGSFKGKGYGMTDIGQYDDREYVFGPSGCCALLSAKMLEDIKKIEGNYFDDDLFAYHEDIDLAFRAQMRNWKCVFVPDAIVYHKHSQSLEKSGDRSP